MSTNWYMLGLQLNMMAWTLDGIKLESHCSKYQLMEMLKDWLKTDNNPQWRTLINALRSKSVGASRLAGDLERKYCCATE